MWIPSCIRKRNIEKSCTCAKSEIMIIIIWSPSDHLYSSCYIDKSFTTFFFILIASLFRHVLNQSLSSDYTTYNNLYSLVALIYFLPEFLEVNQVSLKILAASQHNFNNTHHFNYFVQSQWPRVLRRRSTAARLLRSWVRIPPGTWMFVSCVCLCVVR
jgi:hypothetical protein